MQALAFTLPFALPSLNKLNAQRWARAKRRIPDKSAKDLAWEVTFAVGGPFYFPETPFSKARVTVVRHSAGILDDENLLGSVKPLRDVLCVNSRTHPFGLGIIEDDAPGKCDLIVSQEKAPRGKGFTSVRVENLAWPKS